MSNLTNNIGIQGQMAPVDIKINKLVDPNNYINNFRSLLASLKKNNNSKQNNQNAPINPYLATLLGINNQQTYPTNIKASEDYFIKKLANFTPMGGGMIPPTAILPLPDMLADGTVPVLPHFPQMFFLPLPPPVNLPPIDTTKIELRNKLIDNYGDYSSKSEEIYLKKNIEDFLKTRLDRDEINKSDNNKNQKNINKGNKNIKTQTKKGYDDFMEKEARTGRWLGNILDELRYIKHRFFPEWLGGTGSKELAEKYYNIRQGLRDLYGKSTNELTRFNFEPLARDILAANLPNHLLRNLTRSLQRSPEGKYIVEQLKSNWLNNPNVKNEQFAALFGSYADMAPRTFIGRYPYLTAAGIGTAGYYSLPYIGSRMTSGAVDKLKQEAQNMGLINQEGKIDLSPAVRETTQGFFSQIGSLVDPFISLLGIDPSTVSTPIKLLAILSLIGGGAGLFTGNNALSVLGLLGLLGSGAASIFTGSPHKPQQGEGGRQQAPTVQQQPTAPPSSGGSTNTFGTPTVQPTPTPTPTPAPAPASTPAPEPTPNFLDLKNNFLTNSTPAPADNNNPNSTPAPADNNKQSRAGGTFNQFARSKYLPSFDQQINQIGNIYFRNSSHV